MSPVEILKSEHNWVLMVLEGAESLAKTIDTTGEVDTDKVRKIVDFSRNFTDGSHHTKEEKLLFPKMGEKGFSKDFGPIAVMLMEHVEGRGFVGQIEEALNQFVNGDDSAKPAIARNLRHYIYLLRSHIDKENNILFAMADNSFDDEENAELKRLFEKADAEEMSEEKIEYYHQIARELKG